MKLFLFSNNWSESAYENTLATKIYLETLFIPASV